MAEIKEDYFEQFTARNQEEMYLKARAAAERSKEKGCTFPCVTVFPEHATEDGPLYTFQAWKTAPRLPDICAPAHPMLVPVL